MKYRSIAIFFVIASLFLLFASLQAMAGAAGTAVKLRVPNLPSGN